MVQKNKEIRGGTGRKRHVLLVCILLLALIVALGVLLILSHKKPIVDIQKAPIAVNARKSAETAYILDLCYDEQLHTIHGNETIEITNTSGEVWNEIYLNDWPSAPAFISAPYGGTTELSECYITTGGSRYAVVPIRDDENSCGIYIPLAEGLQHNDSLRLEWELLIRIPQGNDRFGFNDSSCNLGSFIPQLALWRNGGWVTHPYFERAESAVAECADFHLTLTAPKELTVICTGESATTNGVTVATAKDVRDFCVILGEGWHMLERMHGDTCIRSYYKGSLVMGLEALNAAADALDAYGFAIGAYPYATLDIVSTDIWAAGLEYPQLIMMNSQYYAWSFDLIRGYVHDNFRIKVAHEVAHQWFYGIVGNDQYEEAWLDESFATYLEHIYADSVGIHHATAYTDIVFPLNSSVDVLGTSYQDIVYTAGSAFLTDLREIVGDKMFLSMLQELYMTYGYSVESTSDVLSTIRKYIPEAKLEKSEKLIAEYFH